MRDVTRSCPTRSGVTDGGTRKPYPSDLADEQWEPMPVAIPSARPGGRPRSASAREAVDPLPHSDRSGCRRDTPPRDLPAEGTVYEYFATRRDDGTWRAVPDVPQAGVPGGPRP